MATYAEKMGSLFEQGLFADCTIIAADGKKFKAHKGILACHSPVFRAMFERQMIENNKEGIAKIKDIKSPVLEQMLLFIYTERAPKLGEMPIELYEAAVEYQLDPLKIQCENVLHNSIRKENVCELLILADRNSKRDLKIRSIDFIGMNAKEVMKSYGWKMLLDGNHMDLLYPILKAIFEGLPNSIGNENVCELLVLADTNSTYHHNLKANAVDYIKWHANEVMQTNGWKMLVDGNVNGLVEQIVHEIANDRQSSMGNENVCELLVLADQYSAEHLKSRAIKYIQMHAGEVMETNGWKMLVEGNHGKLMEQIMKAFANKAAK